MLLLHIVRINNPSCSIIHSKIHHLKLEKNITILVVHSTSKYDFSSSDSSQTRAGFAQRALLAKRVCVWALVWQRSSQLNHPESCLGILFQSIRLSFTKTLTPYTSSCALFQGSELWRTESAKVAFLSTTHKEKNTASPLHWWVTTRKWTRCLFRPQGKITKLKAHNNKMKLTT